jgi:hypothetical protein
MWLVSAPVMVMVVVVVVQELNNRSVVAFCLCLWYVDFAEVKLMALSRLRNSIQME